MSERNRALKTRLWLAAFAALLFIMTIGVKAQDMQVAGSEEDVLAMLDQMKTLSLEEMQFICEPSFFAGLSADDFALLEVLKVKAGIGDAHVRYSEGKRLIEISAVTWTDAPWKECSDMEQAEAAVSSFAFAGAGEAALICTPALLEELYDNYALYAFAAYAGLDSSVLEITYYSSAGIIRIAGMQPQSGDWYAVSDDISFHAAVEDAAKGKLQNFLIAFDREYYAALSEDPERMEMLILASPIDQYSSSRNDGSCIYTFRDVTYTDVQKLVCATEEAVVKSIKAMGAAGEQAFDLILPSALYDEVTADDFKKLSELEIRGGMHSKDLSYFKSGHHLLSYRDAEISAKITTVSTLDQAVSECMKMAAQGSDQMVLSCSEEVFYDLLGEETRSGMEKIYDVITACGIRDYTISYSRTNRIITILVNEYYPGEMILHALAAGDLSSLDRETLKVYEAAYGLLDALPEGEDELETARLIHDAVCERTEYAVDDDITEDDTAAGVLLDGRANCDGYADAFCLLGTMAGLEVRRQHGKSYPLEGEEADAEQTHMWNLVRIDGTWRLVDATWDDTEDGISYLYFAVGEDRVRRTHIWNKDTAPALAAQTPAGERPENEFAVSSKKDLDSAIKEASRESMSRFTIIFDSEEAELLRDEAMEKMKKAVSGIFRYQWNERMEALTFSEVRYKAGGGL